MTHRTSLFTALIVLFAACRSVASPAPAVAPQTHAPPVIAAPAAPPTAAAPVSREARLAEGIPLLEDQLPHVEDDPAAVRRTLRASRSPAARAWAAWLAHHAGDDADAEATLRELAAEGETASLAPDDATVGARTLWLAREHAEQLAATSPRLLASLPCAVFAWDGADAARAFGPAHGSTRDALVAPFKQRCVEAALERHLGAAGRARALAVDAALTRALFRAWPQPPEGTIWVGASLATRDVMRDSLLGVSPDDRATDVAMRAVVGRLAAADPRSLARVGSYRRTAESHVGALAQTLCALASARGRALTSGQCTRRAYTVTLATFTTWVGALQPR
jgi:hypothetical protein